MPSEESTAQPATPTTGSGQSVGGGESKAFATKGDVQSLAEKQKSDQNLILAIMAGVVLVVVITFWVETTAMHRNYVQDKSLLLQNNQLNKDYFEKVLFLNNEIQDLKTQIEVLRAKNSYLK